MNRHKIVLVRFDADEKHRALLKDRAGGADLFFLGEKEEIPGELLRRADAILGNPDPAVLKGARHLEWLQLLSAGADRYPQSVLPEGVSLTNVAGAYGPSIAEYMICAVMSLMMDFPAYRDNQRNRLWRNTRRMRHLEGTLALSVGFGGIGREFAKRYHALGGHVVGVKRTPGERPDYADAVYPVEKLDSLIPEADVVALSLPSTRETDHLFGESRFTLMKKGSYLVNVGRGTAVDSGALFRALQSGVIAGAALDVTEPEPLPADSPLWGLPNLILTPHIAGRWQVPENYERVFAIVLENLGRYVRGEPLQKRVSLTAGY